MPVTKRNRLARRFPLFLFLLATQAHAGLFDDDVARKKIDDQQQEIQKLKAELDDVETRLKKLEVNPAMIDMASQIQSQNADIATLRGKTEELDYGLQTSQKRQKDFYIDLDTRLRRLEPQVPGVAPVSSPLAVPAAVSAPAAVAPAVVPVPASVAQLPALLPGENADYQAAFNLVKIGNYAGAISGFADFVKKYPASSLAPSAQYWVGNAYFAMRDFNNSITAQRMLVKKYPDSQKVPDALINIASSQQELGNTKEAKKTLESVVSGYPASDAAAKAKRRLEELK